MGKNQIFQLFWFPEGDSDHNQNLTESKLEQYSSLFNEDLTSNICVILAATVA